MAQSVATPVALRAYPLLGWRCPVCAPTMYSNRVGQCEYIDAYPEGEIPGGVAASWVDRGGDVGLCVRREWWTAVRRSAPFRGVLGRPLYVASPDAVEARPALEERKDCGDEAAKILAQRDRIVEAWGIKG